MMMLHVEPGMQIVGFWVTGPDSGALIVPPPPQPCVQNPGFHGFVIGPLPAPPVT